MKQIEIFKNWCMEVYERYDFIGLSLLLGVVTLIATIFTGSIFWKVVMTNICGIAYIAALCVGIKQKNQQTLALFVTNIHLVALVLNVVIFMCVTK